MGPELLLEASLNGNNNYTFDIHPSMLKYICCAQNTTFTALPDEQIDYYISGDDYENEYLP